MGLIVGNGEGARATANKEEDGWTGTADTAPIRCACLTTMGDASCEGTSIDRGTTGDIERDDIALFKGDMVVGGGVCAGEPLPDPVPLPPPVLVAPPGAVSGE